MNTKNLTMYRGSHISSLTAAILPVAIGTLAMLGITAGAASASTIYSDTFTGGTSPLNGATPNTVDAGSATWTAYSNWTDGGYNNSGTAARLNAYLPFTPVGGQIYTLSAGLDVTKQTDPSDPGIGDYWFALGFITSPALAGGWDAGGASPWALSGFYAPPPDTVNSVAWTGPATYGGQTFGDKTTSGVNTISIVLNTGSSLWTYRVYLTNSAYTNLLVGSSSATPFTSNPVITDVGLQNGKGAGYASNFLLTEQAVPEPASLGLVGIGALGLLLLKRRKAL